MVTWSVARPITGPTYFLVRIEVASSDIRLPDDVLETETFDEKMVISNLVVSVQLLKFTVFSSCVCTLLILILDYLSAKTIK